MTDVIETGNTSSRITANPATRPISHRPGTECQNPDEAPSRLRCSAFAQIAPPNDRRHHSHARHIAGQAKQIDQEQPHAKRRAATGKSRVFHWPPSG